MRFVGRELAWGYATLLLCLGGCASPGAPKPPSLGVPQPAGDLSVVRSGKTVEIRFTGPSRTTDGLGFRGVAEAAVCRGAGSAEPCRPVDVAEFGAPLTVRPGEAVVGVDRLPEPLAAGPVRAMAYRVELRNGAGRSAGQSEAVYVAAGEAPLVVSDIHAEGTRAGVLLRWAAVAGGGEVLLERRQLDPPPPPVARRGKPEHAAAAEPGVVWMQAEPGNEGAAETVDGTVREGVRYGYRAVRRVAAQVGGRALELRSAPSAAVEVTWRDAYPPPAPERLTALGFLAPSGSGSAYAVDLVWQPVNDPRVTGYVVRRVALSLTGAAEGAPVQMTAQPVVTPAFHDATASRFERYRYEVVAVDAKGNVSAPATAVVEGMAR